jgi:transcriptional pleiotropic regulator of transition state genes
MELRRSLNIANGDAIEIYVNEDQIVLKKYRPNMTCVMTGEVSDENVQFGDGMHLSKAGAKQLVKEIKKAFNV